MPVSSDNQVDKFAPPEEDNEEIDVTITKFGRISGSCDYSLHFLENANFQEEAQYEEG